MTDASGEDACLEAEVQALMQSYAKKSKKKKSKKKSKKKQKVIPEIRQAPPASTIRGSTTSYPYSYELMLKRVYAYIERDNPDSLKPSRAATRLKLPPLNLNRYKTTRTSWSNFAETCQLMNRPPDHVLKYIEHQLAINASVNGRGHLILPVRMESRRMAQLLNRYVKKYVLCMRCTSCKTTFRKDKIRRLMFVQCSTCHAEFTAPAIQTGAKSHRALKRGDRYRERRVS